MTSTKPYILRAFLQWITDNGMTPYLAVNASIPGTQVPTQFLDNDGKITLNIQARAVREFEIGNEWVHFQTRFSGVVHEIRVPMSAIMAIYAHENGRGMVFGEEYDTSHESNNEQAGGMPNPDGPPPKKPKLTIVKS